MKSVIVTLAIVFSSSFALSQTHDAHGGAASAAPADVTAAAAGAGATKMTKKEAKAVCKTEGKKGKDLKTCIRERSM